MICFRKLIKKQLKKKKIVIPALARAVDCSNQTIYNYLAEDTEINAALLEKILNYLEIKIG